jgi:hypothetical protein
VAATQDRREAGERLSRSTTHSTPSMSHLRNNAPWICTCHSCAVEHTIPTGTFRNQKPIDIRVEQWFSPDLGVIIQTTRWSSIGTEAIHRLEQVVRAEPDATLFNVTHGRLSRYSTAIASTPEVAGSRKSLN